PTRTSSDRDCPARPGSYNAEASLPPLPRCGAGMSFLLMVFLASVCLYPGYQAAPWGGPGWLAALLTFCAVAFVAGCAAVIANRVRRPLDDDPTLLDRLVGQYESMRRWHTIITLAAYVIALGVLGWGHFVRSLYGDDRFGIGAEILLLLPFVFSQVASW